MTDKKKLDEAATLNVTHTDGEMTASTTFSAEDTMGLAQLLKRAGVQSAMFNGPATLTVDGGEAGASVTSTINSPDLRSIMNMLEPEFQATGDLEAGVDDMGAEMDAEMDDDHIVDPVVQPEIYDPGMGPDDMSEPKGSEVDMGMDLEEPALDAPVEEQALNENPEDFAYEWIEDKLGTAGTDEEPDGYGNMTLFSWVTVTPEHFADFGGEEGAMKWAQKACDAQVVDVDLTNHEPHMSQFMPNDYDMDELDLTKPALYFKTWLIDDTSEEGEVDEEAEYDYRIRDAHPQAFAGVGSKEIVQPKTKRVPARSGDNPLEEADGGSDSFDTWIEDETSPQGEVEVTVEFDWDSGNFDTGLDHMPVASMGSSLTITSVVNKATGEDLLDSLDQSVISRLEQQASESDDGRQEESVEPVATGPKTFADYVREANARKAPQAEVVQEVTPDSLLDEYGRNPRDEMERKVSQFGEPFYLNTDCGYASLNELGQHDYFQHDGVVVLEIDRNGKKGLNYVAGHHTAAPGTKVTCVTATSTGQKYRPGMVVDAFTMDEYNNDRAGLEQRLAQHGISPTKKLSVKTFD